MKYGRISDQPNASFALEYDTMPGKRSMMRLEARTYEGAIREARSYLGIAADNRDEKGESWEVE
jgi:hypothetical protein